MSITVLEVVQRMRIPAREVAVDKAYLAVRTVLFTKNIQGPRRDIFRAKGFFDLGKLTERCNIDRILARRMVKNAGIGQVSNFFDNFKARFLRILWRNKGLER